ncbi:hypothetical protein CRI70_23280 [Streptomyces sp. Ru87]|nr:hypothetical protein CRI70_23280 [Streptomyces sp. Ru87]
MPAGGAVPPYAVPGAAVERVREAGSPEARAGGPGPAVLPAGPRRSRPGGGWIRDPPGHG